MVEEKHEIMTLGELQGYLKIPRPSLYAMAQSGRIPASKVGKHWRFRRSEVDEWLKGLQWNRPIQRRNRKKKEEIHAP